MMRSRSEGPLAHTCWRPYYACGASRLDAMAPSPSTLTRDELEWGHLLKGSSPDFVDTVVPQTAIVSYWTGDRYPKDE
jgi:hypothetical protein